MIKPRHNHISEIFYILITDYSTPIVPFLPPDELNGSICGFLRFLPKDIIQIGNALDYYELTKRHGINNPYRFRVIYTHNVQEYIKLIPKNAINVYMINAASKNINEALELLQKNHTLASYYYLFGNTENISVEIANAINKPIDLLQSLLRDQQQVFNNLGLPNVSFTPNIPIYDPDFYTFPWFVPAQNNYHMANSIIGNFGLGAAPKSLSYDELIKLHAEESQKAFENENSFDRQEVILKQIKKVDYFSFLCYEEQLVKPVHRIDPMYAPLILVAPFNNPDIKHILSSMIKDNKPFLETFTKSIQSEQTKNYIIKNNIAKEDIPIAGQMTKTKMQYLDDIAFLHSSFNFSPVLRLPHQGKSIYRELSFFRTEAMNAISYPKNRRNINKTISKFGTLLRERTISNNLAKKLITENRQIVAITDLPIEWLNIDNIPLAFTHDICRLPESSLHGLMASYAINEFFEYSVPSNILKKTLVIFGSEERSFKAWQHIVVDQSKKLGFATSVCLSIEDLTTTVRDFKPDLLIFDCHGGVDVSDKSSYLLLGKERLTGDIIVENNIHAPLVFLSACNTAPTYGTINTIANAFFENSSLSVTTTYLPININTSSILYIRLLNNLKIASSEAIHQNWLSFLSHLIRTSAISEAYSFLSKSNSKNINQSEILKSQTMSQTLSMSFYERRKVYKELDETLKILSGKHRHLFSNIIPEYLFYSNLGRSDLIKFDSYNKKLNELNENKDNF